LVIKGASFVTSLTIALQPLIGDIFPAWSSTVGGLAGFASLSEIISVVKDYINKKKKINQSPIGILLDAHRKIY
jgi:hypothetical protein